jgi:hypothetical protein
VKRSGQIVSRDELQRLLWDGKTFVDFEQGLNSAVNKLRQALGDSADQPRYLETIPGHGYRFIAPVQRAATAAVHASRAPVVLTRTEPSSSRLTGWLLFAGSGVLAILAGGGYWMASRAKEQGQASKPTTVAVPAPKGFAFEGAASRQSFALSPDGSRLAFTAMDSSGSFRVFVRDLNAPDSRSIPESEGAHSVFWHPDGRSLFMTVKGKLYRAPLEGDAHVYLTDAPAFLLSGGTWLSPERILLDGYRAAFSCPLLAGRLSN